MNLIKKAIKILEETGARELPLTYSDRLNHEEKHCPIPKPDPIDARKSKMLDLGQKTKFNSSRIKLQNSR
ncbi:MAG: hypothetical protein NTV01_04480 [Bacteroidia bacterium]|nr:hypothetical protein [Bacteroidia bacterium]